MGGPEVTRLMLARVVGKPSRHSAFSNHLTESSPPAFPASCECTAMRVSLSAASLDLEKLQPD